MPAPERGFLVRPIRRYFAERFTSFERVRETSWKLPVEPRTFLLPGESMIAYVINNFRWIAGDDLSLGDRHAGRYEAEGANDAAGPNHSIVHNDRVHPDEGVAANACAVNNCPVADVGIFLEVYIDTWKHVDDTVLLDVAAILDDDLAPVTADGGAGANVNLSSDDDVADHRRIGVNERVFADYGSKALKGKYVCHVGRLQLTVGGAK